VFGHSRDPTIMVKLSNLGNISQTHPGKITSAAINCVGRTNIMNFKSVVSNRECENFFGSHVNFNIVADDTVLCTTEFSKIVPLEGGEVSKKKKQYFN
jgi:hypothetical protein